MLRTQKLSTYKLEAKESVEDYMTMFQNLQIELKSGGLDYAAAHFILAALNGLPSDYEQSKIIMLNALDVNTVDELERRMLNEDLHRDSCDQQATAI